MEISTKQSWFGVPYPRNRWFTGRDTLLGRITKCLLPDVRRQPSLPSDTAGRVFCIYGLPGIGKTHAAIEFAYRQKDDFTHIFWISADSVEKLEQGYINIARALGLAQPTAIEDRDKLLSSAMSWTKAAQNETSWLLILDNVDNFEVLNRYWSGFGGGAVLITSRDTIPRLSALTSISDSARLEPFSPPEAREMIKKRLSRQDSKELSDEVAQDLAKRFGFYPLYMDQMTSFIESDKQPLSEWCKQLDSEFGDSELQEVDPDGLYYRESVAKAIETHVKRLDVPNRIVLATIGFFDPDYIPERLLLSQSQRMTNLSSAVKRQKTLFALSRSSFIQLSPGRGTRSSSRDRCISLHRLVRDSAIRSCPNTQEAFDNAVDMLRHAFPLHKLSRDHMVEDWDDCETFQPHVLALHQQYLGLNLNGQATLPSFEFIELIYSCAWYMCERGRFNVSKGLIATAQTGHDQIVAAKGDTIPPAFLSDIYTVQQFYHNEATSNISMVEFARKAMDIREAAVEQGLMDPYHPNRANGFMNVGVAMAWDDPRGAIKMHSKALEIRLGSDKYKDGQLHGLALNYLNIGRCWYMVHHLKMAASCFEKCLSLMQSRECEVGKKFVLTAWAMSALGIVRADQNDLETAIKLLSESLSLHLNTMGDKHMKTLACYYRLAWVCRRLGEFERAEQILRLILKTYNSLSPRPQPEIARTKFKLSQVLEDLGVPQSQYDPLRQEASELLAGILEREITEQDGEEEYDSCIAYFLR
ncbi:P-loop containing nucleoside triphosphate hydrolase protein [Lasiosphaeria ovina]|uniref:P-loop containing nucleoside triphosphate hydrolase protein n=1 Tax=Lasiosphaeria ovina TaxID=92902 RepID=A0AAE0KI20_9PEZI|nr:P-loop containing nucleoside triphosphate hydrolase protein [Lasiosphaeria ovina]